MAPWQLSVIIFSEPPLSPTRITGRLAGKCGGATLTLAV